MVAVGGVMGVGCGGRREESRVGARGGGLGDDVAGGVVVEVVGGSVVVEGGC